MCDGNEEHNDYGYQLMLLLSFVLKPHFAHCFVQSVPWSPQWKTPSYHYKNNLFSQKSRKCFGTPRGPQTILWELLPLTSEKTKVVTDVGTKTIKNSSGSFEKTDKIVLKERKKLNIFGTGRKGAIILHVSEEFLKHKNQM